MEELNQEGVDDLNIFIEIAKECVLKTLKDGGILVELDGGIGYNGVTVPQGISMNMFEETFSDLLNEQVGELLMSSFGEEIDEMLSV